MLTSKQHTKKLKRNTIRYAEYYDLQSLFDKLYDDSKKNKVFLNLIEIMSSTENIKLAYRTIKGNTGSKTAGVDKRTIKDLAKLSESSFLALVRKKFQYYKPNAVRRVDIPKPNGETRPLGIPTIIDRLFQQCILQILEPICEAKFYNHSYGFRPNRSAENAIARCNQLIQLAHFHHVVDIDIKGFFDNVCHNKLIRQLWDMGIQDKTLICIIKEMLRAPIVLPNGETEIPTKGTPQGGILSPLLSNIVLNELDWWITSQWETMPTHNNIPIYVNPNTGYAHRTKHNKALRESNLKEICIVRYADDFKIFCKSRESAYRVFHATEQWLKERLKLSISKEKSKVVDLKYHYSEFLGFKMKVKAKKNKLVIRSRMSDKAVHSVKKQITQCVKDIQHPKDNKEQHRFIFRYNSVVIGIHNYYRIATCVNLDFSDIAFSIGKQIKNRLKKSGLSRTGKLENGFIKKQYGRSEQLRFVAGHPLVPVGYVKHKNPMGKRRAVNKYTLEGRMEIHKMLGVNMNTLLWLMRNPLNNRSIEYGDNRISLYAAQRGKCAITGKVMASHEIHCHHIIPLSQGGTDEYKNLALVSIHVHQLIHSTAEDTQNLLLKQLKLNEEQLANVNKMRSYASQTPIIN